MAITGENVGILYRGKEVKELKIKICLYLVCRNKKNIYIENYIP